MGELFREAGDENDGGESDSDRGPSGEATSSSGDRDEESRPSVQAILTAFRAASQRRVAQRQASQPGPAESEEPPSSQPAPSDEPEAEPLETRPEAKPDLSLAEVIGETMAAFRKIERQEKESREEESPPQEQPAEQSRSEEPRSTEPSPKETRPGPAPPEEPAPGEEDEEAASAEDLAPAFRRVLSERTDPDLARPEAPTASEEEGHGGEGEPPSGPSEIAETPEEERASPTGRPEPSFLWVTSSPAEQAQAASVPVDRLSASRAQEAEAFLLQGGGEAPYRLLCRIRRHPEPEVYLKPVFWRRAEGEQSPVATHADGQWRKGDREAFGALREKAAGINDRIEAVMQAEDEGGPELRVLRFVATRVRDFAPRRAEGSESEFVYPKLTPLLERGPQSDEGELAEILSKAARRIRRRR